MTATSTPATSTTADSTPTDSTPTESTATPQSIEGELAMTTTTTVTALNTGRESTPDEGYATENAHSAGIEQRETRHVDPAGAGGAHADTAEDSGRAHRLVWLDPRGLAVHSRNIRDDLGDLSGLADSIAAQGVLEALTVIPHAAADGTPGHQLVAGHRRAAAAILVGVGTVPCVLRPDLAIDGNAADGDRAAQAGHVGAMLAENLHRQACPQ
jgi:ParB family chromosome partitioning protein